MSHTHTSRRDFIRLAAGASAFSAFPYIAKAAKIKPNERINLACCGVGNRAGAIIDELMKTGMFNVVALCDTQIGDSHTQRILKKYPKVARFHDFRKMFDKMEKEIDAVSVGTPDHTHFPICMHAMALGKGVYVEKPLAHTYQECDLLMKAEAKYKVACQMGNQGHSGSNYYQFRAMVDSGVMNNITRMDAHMTKGRRWHKWNGEVPTKGMSWEQWLNKAEEMPKGMDWDTWLGQVPFHPFHKDYINGDWRCWYDFGNGALGDWGAHIIDSVHQFLKLGMPESVSLEMIKGHNDYVFPMSSTLKFSFPERSKTMPAMDIVWSEGVGNLPEFPEGFLRTKSDGSSAPPSGGSGNKVKSLPPGKCIHRADGVAFKGGSHSGTLVVVNNEHAEKAGKLPSYEKGKPNHFMDFALGVKGEKTCNSNFAVGGELSKVLTLGCIAQRLKTSFKFDRKTESIPDNKIANQLLIGPPPRKGWEEYYKV
ncbi:Gfo/Idh/MocA family oxidoreductase [Verrucomicrobiaceae bacterium N1E253]|uniref:Gfo/Idh/MocA family oxidoreductase n=1 Tax=Oceaniferula marina TaxID=2748318 RepID=A0A851GE56_9BACT|nr:Gfo/Idh/MocA family oxidoreductase [Oceaniferula marina]NWK55706.1 Gfo/Idh/MocA family oxidoreductase [Oceaniferula marina]